MKKLDSEGNQLRVWEYNIPEKDIDYTNYNILYSSKKIKDIADRIVEIFGTYFNLRLEMLVGLLDIDQNEHDLMLMALDNIIDGRILIKNRYGFGCYLKEQGNVYFLDNRITVYPNYLNNVYVSNPIIKEYTSMEELIEIEMLDKDKSIIRKFCSNPSKNGSLTDTLHYRTLIVLIEKVYKMKESKAKHTNKEKDIIVIFDKKYNKQNLYTMLNKEVVHIMYSSEYTGVGYNITTRIVPADGSMRVYNNQIHEWEYIENQDIESRYISYIKTLKKKKFEEYWINNNYGMIGFIDKTKKFKIQIRDTGQGRVCTTSKIPNLLEIFFKINYLPPANTIYKDWSKEKLIKTLKDDPSNARYKKDLEKKDKKELAGLLTLLTMKLPELCKTLEKWFKNNDLFYIL